jgi:hypothetical protein
MLPCAWICCAFFLQAAHRAEEKKGGIERENWKNLEVG